MSTPPIDIEREFGAVSNPTHRHCSIIIANTREQAEQLMPLCSGTKLQAIDTLPTMPNSYEGLSETLSDLVIFIPHTAQTLMLAYEQAQALMVEYKLPYKTLFLANEVLLVAGQEVACYRGKGSRDGTIDWRTDMYKALGFQGSEHKP